MPTESRYPAGHGFAWRDDWRKRLSARLHSKGCDSITSFISAHPHSTFVELTSILGEGDFAPIQLRWVLQEEMGDRLGLREHATALLVRFLRESETGWPSPADWDGPTDMLCHLPAWVNTLPLRYKTLAEGVMAALIQDQSISPGWKPSDADDAHLTKAFDEHWTTPDELEER